MAYLNLYVVFGYFWAWNFVIAMADTTVAGSVATWYWTRDKKKLAFWVVFPSFYRYEWNFTAAVCLFVCLFLKINNIIPKEGIPLNVSRSNLIICTSLMCCCLSD